MTVRDWLELLIVSLALVVIGFVFTMQQDERQQRIEDQRARQAQKIENQRAEADRELEEQRAQQDTLQSYLDQMGALLLDLDLRTSDENSDVRRLARARTLVVLEALSSHRHRRALRFLDETELIQAGPPDRPPIIGLKDASVRNLQLSGKRLLKGTDLTQATLSGGELAGADPESAILSSAHLEKANLSGANLRDADLSGAYLHDTDLRGADITNARITEEQLRRAESLEGATMPNGQNLEEWLRSRGG